MSLSGVMSTFLYLVVDNVTLSLVLILTFLYLWSEIRPGLGGKRVPPSPWQLPVVGSLPFLVFNPDKFFGKLLKNFGGVYRIWFGGDDVYMLSSYKAIKEAMITKGDNFSGRQQSFNILSYIWSNKGILIEDGSAWKDQRRFALSTLRDFGFGRFTMEDNIRREADRIAVALRTTTNGMPIDIRRMLINATANVICCMVFGKSFEYGDPEFESIRETFIDIEKNLKFPLAAFMPWTRHVSRYLSGMTLCKNFKITVNKFCQRYIDQHKSTFDEEMLRDYLDCYLAEMFKREKSNNVGSFDGIRLRSNLFVMFFAGVSTTSNTLHWAFKLLISMPEVQERIHEEIDRVVGPDREMAYGDRTHMPFTEAFLCEVQRYADVVPLGVPHSNLEETTLMGYDVPKRATIMANIRCVHQDPALWGDPENFRPSRFLNEQGMLVKPEYLIPFGIGKRQCMGEVLARMELFILLTSLLQKFSFAPEEGADTTVVLLESIARQLPDYKVCVIQRKVA